ncbi:esterase/lipase family protein [Ruania zhangjianzhongii]|uniref:esterase/lipase family protein n=1 Tax=Ruania zhangjianzhongii TaxID=2603206 RepID=UPI0011CA583C|nr:alpha/beta hydrolase [Ruania zhangjianzhongii]
MRASRITTAARRGGAWAADYAYAVRQIGAGLIRPAPEWATSGATSGTQVPVLLIPGIYESWRFLEPLAERLLDAGHPVHVVRELGLNHRSVRSGADMVAANLRTLAAREVVLVAHSKGGLIGKQVLLDRADGVTYGAQAGAGDARPGPRVLGLVAVNTPFRGSAYATFMPVRAVRALSPRALRALAEQRAVDAQITSLYTSWDPHIPGGSELLTARNVQVPAVGHFRILGDRHTQDAIVAAVRSYQEG